MLGQYTSKCLRSIFRCFVSRMVSRQPSKQVGYNDGNRRKAIVSVCWKASALYIAVQCTPSEFNAKNKLHLPEPADLSSLNLIRRAATLTVDAATQLLTQTLAAAMESSEIYRDAVDRMMQYMEESGQLQNSGSYQEQLWDEIISVRNELNAAREALLELESFMEYAVKLATDAAETSYLAGAESMSTAMCERLTSVEQMWNAEKMKIKKAEDMYLKIHEKFVSNYSEPAQEEVTTDA